MIKGDNPIDFLKSTQKKINAYKKIGNDELIIEAEKSYVYEQYDLAYEICNVLLQNGSDYSQEVRIRAYELRALIYYYHSDRIRGICCAPMKREEAVRCAYEILSTLDNKNWDIYDARYALGKMYAEKGLYEKAMYSFSIWTSERDKETGMKALVEMFKSEQYDTDKQYIKLFGVYYAYFLNFDIEDLLLRSAKHVEEYFPQYIHTSISEKLGLSVRQVSHIHYSDEDFVLPYSLRCFDCSDYIRYYVRNAPKPTLEGCMQFLSRREIQAEIERKTANARKKELEEALLRSHVYNENAKVEILRKEAQENERRYRHLQEEMESYNRQMRNYQEQSLMNQKKSLDEQRKIKNAIEDVRSDISWMRWFG